MIAFSIFKKYKTTLLPYRFYDNSRNCLIDIHPSKSDASGYWDRCWKQESQYLYKTSIHSPNPTVIKYTKQYLKTGANILEGGCGLGQNVYGLQKCGYNVWGIDTAETTLKIIKQIEPQLKLAIGDVRSLDFTDDFFDGYWSLGVIEHFWSGYSDIIEEMRRVIKPRGYLFITFPVMNPLRIFLAKRNFYSAWPLHRESELINQFYQFILPAKQVENALINKGFTSIKIHYLDGYKGAKDDIIFMARLNYIAQYIGMGRLLQKILNIFASRFSGHIILLIMQKNG